MPEFASLLLLLTIVTDLAILGTSRLDTCIRAIAAQGALLSVLPFAIDPHWSLHLVLLVGGTFAVKALALPALLRWAIREVSARREIEPFIGYMVSLLGGAVAVALAFAVADYLPISSAAPDLLVPVALTGVMTGLLVLTTRRKAVTQIVGYLMLENGIYVFGLLLAGRVPLLVEAGVLLDVFAGVFVMGVVMFHINREFDALEGQP